MFIKNAVSLISSMVSNNALKPNLVTNGDFSQGQTGWTILGTAATWTFANNIAEGIVTNWNQGLKTTTNITVLPNTTYTLKFTCSNINAYAVMYFYNGATYVSQSSNITPSSANVERSFTFTTGSTVTNLNLQLICNNISGTFDWSNISIS
jgi:hypothetical protein